MPLTPWPMYFAKLPLKARGLDLKVGDPFPVQSKPVIRGLAAAYGYIGEKYTTMPFHELPFVEVRNVSYGLERALNEAMQGTKTGSRPARKQAATEAV